MGTTLLLSLGESANAAAVAWRLRDRLVDAYYTHLIDLAKQFEAAECALGAVLCLRALIDQILAAGQTKTYRYAKRYLDRLVALDGCAEDPRIAFLSDIVVIKKAVTRVRGNPHTPVSEIRTVLSDMGFDVYDDLAPGIRHESLLLAQLIGHSLVH